MYLIQGSKCNPGQTMFKRANSRKRERSNSISSTKSNPAYATPPKVSHTDATGNAGKMVGGILPMNFAAGYMWPLDGHDGLGCVSCGRMSIPPPFRVRSANVLGITESNINVTNRTSLKGAHGGSHQC